MKSKSFFSLGIIFVTLFAIAGHSQARLAGADERKRARATNNINNVERRSAGDIVLGGNKNVLEYTAYDLKAVNTPASPCPRGGPSIHSGNCMTFSSASTRTTWKIRFVRDGRAETIFKMQNGTAVPWVFFEEPAGVQYLSADARRLAVKGTEGASVALPPPIRQQGNCGGKNVIESTLCGLQNAPGVDPAIGGMIGGLLGR